MGVEKWVDLTRSTRVRQLWYVRLCSGQLWGSVSVVVNEVLVPI